MTVNVRAAGLADVPALFDMLNESARDQGFPDEVAVTVEDLRRDGFGSAPLFRALIAEVGPMPAGMAIFFHNYSTWGSRLGLYLEDLYVRPEHRRFGVARALLRRLAILAEEEGCGRLQWVVHRANASAIRLYEAFGARALEDWKLMSVKGAALQQASASAREQDRR